MSAKGPAKNMAIAHLLNATDLFSIVMLVIASVLVKQPIFGLPYDVMAIISDGGSILTFYLIGCMLVRVICELTDHDAAHFYIVTPIIILIAGVMELAINILTWDTDMRIVMWLSCGALLFLLDVRRSMIVMAQRYHEQMGT